MEFQGSWKLSVGTPVAENLGLGETHPRWLTLLVWGRDLMKFSADSGRKRWLSAVCELLHRSHHDLALGFTLDEHKQTKKVCWFYCYHTYKVFLVI